ncbi:type II toxin-antitoxin system HicA family toxin [Cutibacterium acnes]|uniref:type II toxin-antitoxin system HicA family toxin n=1 Tax=Cutibacterium acnes TaxID=1747 RepID=UPI000E503548|nr:type II toxin-antitoxin system HicA family toxin [Cutibacterium acnes]RHV99247.1 type II toxin-antitoxin system HicA family toxin [Propionibacterium sp. KPL2009]HBM5066876.1 type II toxin-antitoxin system HicA family toxin [Shigella sonnei]
MKPQKTKDVLKLLRSQGWGYLRDAKGSHEIWGRPNGAGRVSIPTGHRLMSAGVLAQLERAGVTIPKEWK